MFSVVSSYERFQCRRSKRASDAIFSTFCYRFRFIDLSSYRLAELFKINFSLREMTSFQFVYSNGQLNSHREYRIFGTLRGNIISLTARVCQRLPVCVYVCATFRWCKCVCVYGGGARECQIEVCGPYSFVCLRQHNRACVFSFTSSCLDGKLIRNFNS